MSLTVDHPNADRSCQDLNAINLYYEPREITFASLADKTLSHDHMQKEINFNKNYYQRKILKDSLQSQKLTISLQELQDE